MISLNILHIEAFNIGLWDRHFEDTSDYDSLCGYFADLTSLGNITYDRKLTLAWALRDSRME